MDASKNFGLVLCGVAIALLNMGIAWYVIWSSNAFVMTGLVTKDNVSATSQAVSMITDATSDQLIVLNKLVEADVNHRLIANKQALIIAAMAASFSLVAVGFALFVMGVEAAYTISGKNPTGSIVFQASSPGLICFLFAALIICFSVGQRMSVDFGNIRLGSDDVRRAAKDGPELKSPVPFPTRYLETPPKSGGTP
jgi:hypothetical protein